MTTIIEFFGLPGSGKSSIANGVITSLRENGIKASAAYRVSNNIRINSMKRLFLATQFYIFHWKDMQKIFKIAPARVFRSWIEKIKQRINIAYVMQICVQRDREKVVVLDQGLVQSTTSLFFNELEFNDCARVLNTMRQLLTCNWIPVHISVPTEVALDRAMNRNYGNTRITRIQDELAREKIVETLNRVNHQLAREYKCFEVDNVDHPVELAVGCITKYILTMINDNSKN